MKLGMNTVILGAAALEQALQCVAWSGYKYVELAAIAGMAEHIKFGDNAGVIRELLQRFELEATAIEAATNDRERLQGIFALAAEIGVPIVNIGSGGKTGDENSTVESIELMGEFARMAADAGVTLAVKPHVGQAIYNANTGLRLMEELDGKVPQGSVGLNFDPSHLARADDNPSAVAPRWDKWIVTSHFRDCPVRVPGPPGTPEQQVPGNGALDLKEILQSLNSIGYNGPLNLEIIGAQAYDLPRSVALCAQARGYLSCCLKDIEAA